MARTMGLALNTIGANPYPPARDKAPDFFFCELCHRKIGSKDWTAHQNSKKHRANEDEERRAKDKDNYASVDDTQGNHDQGAWVQDTGSTNYARAPDNRACYGCGEEGHTKRDCPKSAGGNACYGCGKEGHQKRECPDRGNGGGDRACFNCGMTGHRKADCTSAPQARQGGGGGGQQCFNCFEYGHRKTECTNERVLKCRNCDEIGHMSKECPKPTDWSKVQCNNCKEYGHTVKRCPAPPAEDTNGGGWGETGADADTGAAPTGNWADDSAPAGDDNWGSATAGGGW